MQNDALKIKREVNQTNISLSIRSIKTSSQKITCATHEQQYYRTLLETSIGNSKKIWSNINYILGKKHSSINTNINLDSIHVADPEIVVNAFNYYFNSIPITFSDNINNNLTEACPIGVCVTLNFFGVCATASDHSLATIHDQWDSPFFCMVHMYA